MVVLQIFTQLMNALVGSNTNLGKKWCNYYAKNDATITLKMTTQLLSVLVWKK